MSKVSIELTENEAIVLFDYLSRFNNKMNPQAFEDQSEQRVLWDIESTLEQKLSVPFGADYTEILKKAREIVRAAQNDLDS
jgi:hypothetical protein